MSWEATQWANKQRLRLPQEQLVLLLLANCADPEGVAFGWWKHKEHWWTYLCEHSRLSRATVFRHLGTIEALGLGLRQKLVLADGTIRYSMAMDLTKFVTIDPAETDAPPLQSHYETESHDETESHSETESVSLVRLQEDLHKESKILTPTPSKEGVLKNQPQISEAARQRFQEFKAAYPDGIVDLDKAEKEFVGLTDADQEACVTAAPVYAARCRKRREKSKKAHLFIRERAWVGLLASSASVDGAPCVTSHSPHSEAGKGLITLSVIAGHSLFRLPGGNISYVQPVTPQLLALANPPPGEDWIECELGGQDFAAWRGLIYRIFAGRTLRSLTKYRVPWRWPPTVDGKTYAGTDPPPGELSDADVEALTGT